eukprot:7033080-Prymnesium_polylepis.1
MQAPSFGTSFGEAPPVPEAPQAGGFGATFEPGGFGTSEGDKAGAAAVAAANGFGASVGFGA